MRESIKYHLILFFFFTPSLFADQLIIEPEMGRAPIINAINETETGLRLVMYGFTDKEILQALLAQKSKGKEIRVILEKKPYKNEEQNKKTFAAFKRHKIDWQGKIKAYRLIHEKALMIDGSKAIIMTFNFTNSTFKKARNFALIIDDPKRVQGINALFEADWQHYSYHAELPDLIISPDNSRLKVTKLLKSARKSIKIYAQNVSDYEIIGTLATIAKSGVEVKILTSGDLKDKQAAYLSQAGVQIGKCKKYYIHAKVIIIDDKMAILGSLNLTRASFDNNRELSIVTTEPSIITALLTTFNIDWHNEPSNIAQVNWLYDDKTHWYQLRNLKKIVKAWQYHLQRSEN